MKKILLLILVSAVIFSACKTPQKVTSTWVNKEFAPNTPYKKIMVIVMANQVSSKYTIEKQMAQLLKSRGRQVVESNDIFPPSLAGDSYNSRDILIGAINRAGCDAVFTIAILDTKTETSYQPGSYYSPISMYDYYGNFGSYYNYRMPAMYSPGYYTENKTYYLETNFYDLKGNTLIWSIQSSACNITDLDKWFKEYSYILKTELIKQGLIKE